MITSEVSHPTTRAVNSATSAALSSPTGPVATLAFLEMITTARARPSATCSLLSVTLGPENRLFVKTPAALVPGGADRIITSSVRSLIPMLPVCKPNPAGNATSRTTMPRAFPPYGLARIAPASELSDVDAAIGNRMLDGADGSEPMSARDDRTPVRGGGGTAR